MLLGACAEVDGTDHLGRTALMRATAKGHFSVTTYLIEHGADVHTATDNGVTALIAAAEHGNTDVVIALLKHGADPSKTTSEGLKAVDMARKKGHQKIEAILKKYQSIMNLNRQNKEIEIVLTEGHYIPPVLLGPCEHSSRVLLTPIGI